MTNLEKDTLTFLHLVIEFGIQKMMSEETGMPLTEITDIIPIEQEIAVNMMQMKRRCTESLKYTQELKQNIINESKKRNCGVTDTIEAFFDSFVKLIVREER